MAASTSSRVIGTFVFMSLISGATPCFADSILFANSLPTINFNGPPSTTRVNVAPVYNAPPLMNPNSITENYILGDQFLLSQSTNTITSVTIFEVGNAPTTSTGAAIDTPDTEFNNLSLYLGPDGSVSGLGAPLLTLADAALNAASSQVYYPGGLNYQSVNSTDYFPIFAVTFNVNVTLGPGFYDFAVGASPKNGNTFALHMSDPSLSGAQEDINQMAPSGYLYFFPDGTDNAPLETYQYQAGYNLIDNWSNPGALDANVIIQGETAPEPGTIGLVCMALAGIVVRVRRQVVR